MAARLWQYVLAGEIACAAALEALQRGAAT